MYPSSHVTRLLVCISVYSLSGFIPSQVILSTNIAESSITVPDIRYGKPHGILMLTVNSLLKAKN